ncbi:polyketide synthase [Arthroderma uncinatum]|uniref:polyketide synthase n=1 Tax=Arthroderma uncinatum TaxID=74035 RepID=UPI00144A6683|nr:polyketide synthase [Arthroderma uncinatum]KAF3480301.1 polyketide synthase [Arthroderma uncinatum]
MGSIQSDLPTKVNGAPNGLPGPDLRSNGTSQSSEVPLTSNGCSDLEGNGSANDFPIAICGMSVRLPGGLASPQEFWDFLVAKGDARGRVPKSRYNISAYHSTSGRPGTIATEYGYFLDESVNFGSLDASRFSLSRAELEFADPQQRLMLEVVREALDDAGEIGFRGSVTGCYMGSYGEDWLEMQNRDHQQTGVNRVDGYSDFMLSSRISYEMDLKGPTMTVRTACSAALICLHEAVSAIQRGDCQAAVVGGANLIMAPGMTAFMTEKGVLSADGSCKTFSADANGYARGEAVTAVYIKPLVVALRDGNPVRAVIRSTASNGDGRTQGIAQPSTESQEVLIRKAYEKAGITDFSKTAFVECHGTGTSVGDPIEANAVARVFGDSGVYIGSVKPNLGHSEGASGLTALIKAVLTLENQKIPPNIKFSSPNPKIPFKERKLVVPLEPTPWPEACYERVSVNSFGIGGSNAHVILDSARSFNIHERSSKTNDQYEPNKSHLLLLSANSAASLAVMTNNFRDWVGQNPESLEDLAYTLAHRRERLSHRSYLVASADGSFGAVSQGLKVPTTSPNLVMVFTGQGAQWPRMGRQLLLRSDLCFQSSIRVLDEYLRGAPDAPTWTLEEELLKPARTSRVQTAELSQPLCTAVQIALVDLLAVVGVKPSAVVGHSSGEIAAAYASGALTAKEAIISAWQRGIAAKKQTRPGAMAAIGLGWDEVSSFLTPPKVVVACENSPRSVTLSGDTEVVQSTISRIKEAHPDVTAKLLKVEKAYHSYHMREVGDEYVEALRHDVQGKPPSVPFFSSVSGTGRPEQDSLDAKYWQRNLESPVLFKTAIAAVLDQIENVTFLEIGPHPALAGPVRQIMTQASRSAPYVGVMERGADCVGSFLTALGKLFELNVSVNFTKLIPRGTCLPDLPRYPWDHKSNYWRESRISQEWRDREFPAHPLLGVRQLESTTLEPSFRNMLLIENASWLRDHKIEDNVIFPCAGYVAMVGEGIRQISGSQASFTLRNIVLSSALVLSEDAPTELVTTFRPVRLTDSMDSGWWDFTVASHNGNIWMKHCTGQVASEKIEPVHKPDEGLLPRKVQRRKYYDILSRAGIGYGPHFQRLEDIRTGTVDNRAVAHLTSDVCGDEEHYHIHPTVIDACIQSGPLAATRGRVEAKHYRRVPTKIDRVTVHRCASVADIKVAASAVFIKGSGDVVSRVQCISNGDIVLDMEGAKLSPLEEAEELGTDKPMTSARLTWGPHIDFLDATRLIKPEIPRRLYTPTLDKLTRLCLVYAERRIERAQTTLPHMAKYMDWITREVRRYGDHSLILPLDDRSIKMQISSLVQDMTGTPVEDCATAIQKVVNNIEGLFSGQTDALELLLADNTLTKLYIATDAMDRSQFIRHLAHSKPNLRILEIGAGTGASTSSMLKHLVLPTGQLLYSKYAFTDISSAFFVSAKDHFKDYRNIEYRVLDISQDPAEQGFEDDKFDLIIATNVLHATRSLNETLRNVHHLLGPGGRLLLHELDSASKWPNFIFGTLPGWWYGGPDGRPDEPYITPTRWESELRDAGFNGLDAVVLDAEEGYQLNATMVASPQAERKRVNMTISVLCDEFGTHLIPLCRALEARGFIVQPYRLGQELPAGQDVISLLDGAQPFFKDIDESRFTAFQRILDNLGQSALFWVTKPCQIQCREPDYAQVIGTARTIRTEMLLDFATCEVDHLGSSLEKVVDVFSKFQTRVEDETFKPEHEYAICDGTINVGRIYPFSLQDELSSATISEERIGLDMGKPGRLNTLKWAPREQKALHNDDVEVQVHAAGLNFKDVLGSLAVVPYPQDGLGIESSGIVCRVGPEVVNLRIGDRVMLLGNGSFGSHVVTPERLCTKIPANLSFEDAATMPGVFATAVCSLFHIGKLQKGQSVLIHSACGGVGLAAIQLARMAGAEIYATVGSEEKINHLVETFGLPRNRIFHSRDTSFVEGIMRETNGEGVVLALNSLSGELLHATWRCVAEFGTLVEIGKRDFLGAGKLDMDVFLGSRTYACFYLDALMARRQSKVKELLQEVVWYLQGGHITPIRPKKAFNASQVEDAFRYMQQGLHLGKIVISIRNTDGDLKIDTASVKVTKELNLDSGASYLLVGGLGGLGRAVARHLVERNARRVVFLSRSAGNGPEDPDTIKELESMGCEIRLVKGSVLQEEDVARALEQAPNLKGIVQCSMVLRDENFSRMSIDEWRTAVAPKVQGTWNLHHATLAAGIQLDFFILFSSMSGVTGQAGQSNYAGANTFLDSFVQYRTTLGLAASSLDIGAVQDVGYVSQDDALLKRMKLASAHGITESELMEAVSAAALFPATSPTSCDTLAEQFADKNTIALGLSTAIPLSSSESRAFWRKDVRMAAYHNSSKVSVGTSGSNSDNLKSFLAQAKKDTSILSSEEAITFLAQEIGKKLFVFLLKLPEDLDTSASLAQLGMDSLVGVEMRSWWRQAFGFDISVLELLGTGNLNGLGRHAAEGILKTLGEEHA